VDPAGWVTIAGLNGRRVVFDVKVRREERRARRAIAWNGLAAPAGA
jgi:hypothetical protein